VAVFAEGADIVGGRDLIDRRSVKHGIGLSET